MTADVFLVEGINNKLKWLARRIRHLDDHTEIEKWGIAIRTLEAVRRLFLETKMTKSTTDCTTSTHSTLTISPLLTNSWNDNKWQGKRTRVRPILTQQLQRPLEVIEEWPTDFRETDEQNHKQTLKPPRVQLDEASDDEKDKSMEAEQVLASGEVLVNIDNGSKAVEPGKVVPELEKDVPVRVRKKRKVLPSQIIRGKSAPADIDIFNEPRYEAEVTEEEKERWLKVLGDRMVKDWDDTKPCWENLCRYNTDWKFNRLLKEVAKELQYELKEDSKEYPLPEKLWNYLFKEINQFIEYC